MPNDKTELLIYTPTLDGGVGRIISNLAKELVEKNYEVEVLVNQITKESFVDSSLSIVDLNQARTFKNLLAVVVYLRQRKPKVFMSAIYHGNLISLLAHILAWSNSKMVICEHIALNQALSNENVLKRFLLKILIRIFYRYADSIVTVSEAAAKELILFGVPESKIKVIYNPVIANQLLLSADEKIDFAWFNPKTSPVLLAVGRFTPQKDFVTLIKAFAEVRKKKDIRLVILGDGPQRDELKNLINQLGIEPYVSMPGFIKNPYPYFKSADIFVLSSRWEGLPTVLIEALALGLPVVSTDCPSGPNEILKEGNLGRLVPIGDVEQMAEAIIYTLDNPLQKPTSNDLERYTLQTSVNKYIEVLT